jgi:C-terminal peptidase prc
VRSLTALLLVATILLSRPAAVEAAACGTSEAQPPGLTVVKEAFDLLTARFVEPLPASILLPPAAAAVHTEVRRNRPTPIPNVPENWTLDDSGDPWARFAERYCLLWEARPEGLQQETVSYAAIRAMTAAAKEGHTGFLTPQMYRDHQEWASGQLRYEGVGVRLRTEPLRVDYVFPESPAERGGIQAGDEFVAIDGKPARDMTAAEAASAVRGPAGTKVKVTMRRAGRPDFEIELERASIRIESIESRILDNNIGYVHLRGFPRPALYREMEEALASLEERGARALVLDLRGNGGGRLDVGTRIAGLFVQGGTPLYRQTTRSGETTSHTVASQSGWAKPVAVLVDEGTASMAELLAAAIQEQGVGPVIGTRTAGSVAGSVVVPLSDGSALQITVLRIDTGMGRVLNATGLQPDLEVRPAPPGSSTMDAPLAAAVTHLQQRLPAAAAAEALSEDDEHGGDSGDVADQDIPNAA